MRATSGDGVVSGLGETVVGSDAAVVPALGDRTGIGPVTGVDEASVVEPSVAADAITGRWTSTSSRATCR
ncbi:hypothetical protein BKA01_000477 [Pseudonocardia eucalypti]|uniref:hypothetical protein n=1 Tax=Pseudonocardia eucalypti TaxID=648755 RepID=UPI00161063AF|nr:hypothetical protein [Pseudonocardia eucalypti]